MYSDRAKNAMDFTSKTIDAFGPRLAGSEACHKAAEAILRKVERFCDKAAIEKFTVHPGAFLGFIKVLVVAYAIDAVALAFFPAASVTLGTASIAVLVFGFLLYHEMLDPFFPKMEGRNVIGVLEPEGEVLRQVIVSGHHDSARIFNFYIDRPELYSRRIYGGIGNVIALWIVSIVVALVSGLGMKTAPIGVDLLRAISAAAFLALFPFVLHLWFFASDKGTPGAGDNLVASALALEIVAEFARRREEGKGLAHTRLVFASFDAEEAGLRGARAFARRRRRSFPPCPATAKTWTASIIFPT